jgi:hypothetical protein
MKINLYDNFYQSIKSSNKFLKHVLSNINLKFIFLLGHLIQKVLNLNLNQIQQQFSRQSSVATSPVSPKPKDVNKLFKS